MDESRAIELLHELLAAEIEVVKASNSNRGVSRAKEHRERKAVQAVFRVMTGYDASDEQLTQICNY